MPRSQKASRRLRLRRTLAAITLVGVAACGEKPTDPTGISPASAIVGDAPTASAGGTSAIFPLSVSSDRRHLLDKNGNPFFINGDTPWELIQNLTLADADSYLTDRKNRGFNAVLIELIEHQFSPNPPYNVYGVAPFTTPGDFSTPNEAYFAHVDAVLQKALEKEIAVFMTPIYLGYNGGNEGWYAEVNANGTTKMRNFGRYLGNRYRNFPNLVWVMGGDYGPNGALAETRAVVQGIEEMAGPQMFTVHNAPLQSGVSGYQTPADAWIDVNTTYANQNCSTTPSYLAQDYNRVWNGGPIPFFFIEGNYEPGNQGGLCQRSQAYWPVLMGGVGHFYGNEPLWNLNMGANWQQYLNSPIAQDMIHWKNLFASRATHLLVPDVGHVVLTAGYGSLNNTYAAAARASDGRTVMVYVPTQRALTIDMTKVSGSSAIAWWFNPDTGVATQIGTYATTGSRSFTPPSSADWILVIDNAAAGYGPPGSGTTAADTTPPSPPTNLIATAVSSTRIDLTWTASTDNVGVTAYGVIRNGALVGTPTSTGFSDTGLSPSTTYQYYVVAVDAAQNVSAPGAPASATTKAPPPVAVYDFNEGSGTVLNDLTGSGHPGTIQGAPSWATGRNGLAIDYDGVNDNVTLGNLSALNGVARVTIAAWMKRAAPGSMVLLGKSGPAHNLGIAMWSNGRLYFQLSNGAEASGSIALNDTNWHHVALVFDGTLTGNASRLKAYVDGNPVTLTFYGTVPATTTTNTTSFNLGTIMGSYMRGMLDDVWIFNRALSQMEVQYIKNMAL